MKKTNAFWETIGYISLALCVFGQITVGGMYIIAQFAYLIANVANVIRDCVLRLPPANIVRDVCFTGITVALIIIAICF